MNLDEKTQKQMTRVDFIKHVLIGEIGEIGQKHPYLAFSLIAIGIEFLGKCIDTEPNKSIASRFSFNYAIASLNGFEKYRDLIDNRSEYKGKSKKKLAGELCPNCNHLPKDFDLYDELRCGMCHALLPKGNLLLSDGNEEFSINDNTVTLHLGRLYEDFKNACYEVIEKIQYDSNYHNDDILVIKDYPPTSGSI